MSLRPSIAPWGVSSFICNPSWMFLDFNENFRHSFTYCIFIWLFSIFLLSPYSNEIFMLRLQGVPISYPQLLLNLWVDFNEKFIQTFFYIHWRCTSIQMLYEIWLFSIVLLSPYSNEIFMLDFRGYPSRIHNSS